MSTDLVAQTEQQLFALYDQRDQLEQQQQQLMQYTPDYQSILDNPAQVEQFYKQNAQLNTPQMDTNKPVELKKSDEALVVVGIIAFVMLIIAALIKLSFQIIENNPEASAVLLATLIGLFLIFKKGDK